MEVGTGKASVARIGASPPGRGVRPRPRVTVNADYVSRLLAERRLTERDELLLQYLNEVGVLSSRQIKMLLWDEVSWANMHRRLRKLYDYYLLDRTRMLNKTEGITYVLGKAGKIWLHGSARGGAGPRVNTKTLAHDLGVSEVLVRFRTELLEMDYEEKWGFRLGWKGKQNARIVQGERMVLEPDAFFYYYSVEGEREVRGGYFLEMDMGTMTGGVFAEKAKRYRRAASGSAWGKFLQKQGIDAADTAVMVLTTSLERARNLARRVAGVWGQGKESEKIMWLFNTLDSVSGGGFYERSDWIAVMRDGRRYEGYLLDEPTTNASAFYKRGLSWEERDDAEMALAYYAKCLEIDNKHALAYFKQGNIFFGREDWGRAIANYDRVIELNPDYVYAYYNRGLAKERRGMLLDAIADYKVVIRLRPEDAKKWNIQKRIAWLEKQSGGRRG